MSTDNLDYIEPTLRKESLSDKGYVQKQLQYQIEVMRKVFQETRDCLAKLAEEYNRITEEIAMDIEIANNEENLREAYFINEYDIVKREWEDEQRENGLSD